MVSCSDVPHFYSRIPRSGKNREWYLRNEANRSHVLRMAVFYTLTAANSHHRALALIGAPDTNRPIITTRCAHIWQDWTENNIVNLPSVAFESLHWIGAIDWEIEDANHSVLACRDKLVLLGWVPLATIYFVRVRVCLYNLEVLARWIVFGLDNESLIGCSSHDD